MNVQIVKNIQAEKEIKEFFQKIEAEAGYFGGDEENEDPDEAGETIAAIAAKNEVTRPFMSRAAEEAFKKLSEFYKTESLKPNYNAKNIYGRIGLFVVSLIKKEIDTSPLWAEPNSQETIDEKGSSHPLIDTGTMRNNADYRVTNV